MNSTLRRQGAFLTAIGNYPLLKVEKRDFVARLTGGFAQGRRCFGPGRAYFRVWTRCRFPRKAVHLLTLTNVSFEILSAAKYQKIFELFYDIKSVI